MFGYEPKFCTCNSFCSNHLFFGLFEGERPTETTNNLSMTMEPVRVKCSVKLALSIIWSFSIVLCLLLHVPGEAVGHGQRWCAGDQRCGRGADFRRIRLQAALLVLVQFADDDAAEFFVVFVTGVQKLADLRCARQLVDHQFVILSHQHVAGQQGVQALVEASFCHLGDDLLTS